MSGIDAFLTVVDSYRAATNLAEATVSTRVLRDGKGIGRIRAGRDIGSRKVETAIQWFSDNWPGDAPWPDAVDRPAPAEVGAA